MLARMVVPVRSFLVLTLVFAASAGADRVYDATGQPARGVLIHFAMPLISARDANLIEDPGHEVRFTRMRSRSICALTKSGHSGCGSRIDPAGNAEI